MQQQPPQAAEGSLESLIIAYIASQPGRKLCVPYDALRDVIATPGREWALIMQRDTAGVVISAEVVE